MPMNKQHTLNKGIGSCNVAMLSMCNGPNTTASWRRLNNATKKQKKSAQTEPAPTLQVLSHCDWELLRELLRRRRLDEEVLDDDVEQYQEYSSFSDCIGENTASKVDVDSGATPSPENCKETFWFLVATNLG